MMPMNQIVRIVLHFAMLGFSFYALSGIDLSKVMLKRPNYAAKGQLLLVLAAMALAYLSAQFILAIIYRPGA